nr:PREDICTED: acyl-CoA Delta(11) desaturase-like [Bemisia tabaci]
MAPKSSDQRESNENISVLPTSINYADPDLEIDEQYPPPGPSSHKSGDELSKVYFSSLVNLATGSFYTLFGLLKHSILRPYIIFWHELSMDPRVRLSPWSPPPKDEVKMSRRQISIVRRRRFFTLLVHVLAVVGFYYCLAGQVKVYTVLWAVMLGVASSTAVTAGAHRLWSHHSFKATWQLRLLLMVFQTMALEFSILDWVRNHRVHHKFVDTDADPHNARRGFFFSHVGWVLVAPHPAFLAARKRVYVDDVQSDWVVTFQARYYWYLNILLCYIIPTVVPWYFWNENFWAAHFVAGHLRQVIFLHGTFTINSIAHKWGIRPYDSLNHCSTLRRILPTENMFVSFASMGDGWHNYHHVFPWDYKNSELWDYKLNLSALLVDICAKIGWAYDLKTVSHKMVAERVKKTGDGTHPLSEDKVIWGWNDEDMSRQEREVALITHEKLFCKQN